MVHEIDGRLSPEQMNIIAGVHREWCDARSIDPQSGHGLDAARAMMVMYQSGKIWRHELVAYVFGIYPDGDGGRGGIRTHGTVSRTPVFKTGSLNHSDTLPSD